MRIELLLFLSFLALVIVMIACSMPRRPSPVLSSTLFPQITLTTYDPRMVTHVSMQADIAVTVLPAKRKLPEVDISPPRCYRTISPQLTCFGYLYNRAKTAISDISLAAKTIVNDDASSVAIAFSLEQWRIPAGGKAPYRLNMPDSPLASSALEIALENAQFAPATSPKLIFEDRYAEYQQGENSYRLRGILRNESDRVVEDIRLIITLEDETGAITGYRAIDISGFLSPNDSRAIDVSITALERAVEIRHRVTAQAFPAD